MISWNYMLVGGCVLAAFLLYKEWKRVPATRLAARLIASLLAVISLLAMAYPFKDNNKSNPQKKHLVLTPGFIHDSVDNFIRKNNGAVMVYSDEHSTEQRRYNEQLITNWKAFAANHATDTPHVFGNGFSNETLALLAPHPIVFHASPATPAITAIYWKQTLETGAQLQLQGHYNNTSNKNIQLVLQAFGVGKDSVVIDAGTQQPFQLHTIPVHTGRAVYTLIATAGTDTLQQEPVPVDVQPTTPLRLLIISASPDFDNTYLKNHLSQKNYQVTITTTISNNKTDKQFLNMPLQQGGVRLSGSYLNKFDVLITDQQTLQLLGGSALLAIRLAVQDKGLGLIIKTDAQKSGPAFYSRYFQATALPAGRQPVLQLLGNAADSNKYQLKVTNPVAISYVKGAQIILQDAQSNIYALAALYGSGKIIGITLQNTYSMALAGNQAAYQQLWWMLLSKAAKKINPEAGWRLHPFTPFQHYPVHMELDKSELATPHLPAANATVYFKQDALMPFTWHGVYWPQQPGWQPWPGEDSLQQWYVYQRGNWQSLINHSNRTATTQYAALHPVNFSTAKPVAGGFTVNRQLYLLIIFFSCCVFLWVEQKIG